MWITQISIKNPVFASMVMAALLVLGLVSYGRLPVERLPDIASPEVFIQLNYPGASPEAIENDLIKPIEDQINTISGVKHIFATAKEGNGFMQVEFRLDVDSSNATQELRDKVALIRPGFPREAKDPLIVKADISGESQPVVQLALRSDTRTLRELTTFADQIIAKQLRMVSGVGNVNIGGGVNRQVQLLLHPSQMSSLAVGVDQVISAVQDANQDTPAGSIVNGRNEQLLRIEGKIKDPKQFGQIIVARQGDSPVYLSQVADVVDGEEERTSISRYNGQPALGLDIVPIQGANIVELGESVKQAVAELKKRLPTDVELVVTHANSDDIKNSLDQTKETIMEGALLTILIVFMFLHSWRSTVITALTLPISVVAAFIVVHAFGFSLNMLTLMALSLSIGLLIDDAIVVRENIVRHLAMGKSHIRAALEGTQEIGLAVMATTFAIVVVFVPVAFMKGIIGRFFYQFGITVAVAVMVSLFVSFTLDPMLSSIWEDPETDRFKYAPWLGRFMARFESLVELAHAFYGRSLEWALANRWKTVFAAFLVFIVSVVGLTPFIGTEFVPRTDDGFVYIKMNTPVGASLDYTDAKVRQVEDSLKTFKEIDSIQATVGTDAGKNYADISLKLVDRHKVKRRSQEELEKEVRRVVSGIAGIELSVGFDKPIFISVLGPDSGKLSAIASGLMTWRVAKRPQTPPLQCISIMILPAT
jgi:multidrug efflux pump subunit AcrB